MTTAVYGIQWGDEGKGKLVDILAEKHDIVVRCQGGDNAGHTVFVKLIKRVLHLIPSGILRPQTVNVIGNGVVVNPSSLAAEIEELHTNGVEINGERLRLSDRANLILPYHIARDCAAEIYGEKTGEKIGTTLKGIGPAYEDKVARRGIRVCDVLTLSDSELEARVAKETTRAIKLIKLLHELTPDELSAFDDKNRKMLRSSLLPYLHRQEYLDIGAIMRTLKSHKPMLQELATDTSAFLADAHWKENKKILFEGAQGSMLDIDMGTYPFVTSSNTGVGGIVTGSGVYLDFDSNIGVMKAYTTRVGGGPFITELTDDIGTRLQTRGAEFGATTGRPRRCGWLDLVAVQHAINMNGTTEIALMKLDVLDEEDEIRVCVGYERNGKPVSFPASIHELKQCTPVYHTLPGWKQPLGAVRRYADLPVQAQNYVDFIENRLDNMITIVSVGCEREQIIWRE